MSKNTKPFSEKELDEIKNAAKIIANILKDKKTEGVSTSSFDGSLKERKYFISFSVTITDND